MDARFERGETRLCRQLHRALVLHLAGTEIGLDTAEAVLQENDHGVDHADDQREHDRERDAARQQPAHVHARLQVEAEDGERASDGADRADAGQCAEADRPRRHGPPCQHDTRQARQNPVGGQ